jgi:beta-galactosidase GanA
MEVEALHDEVPVAGDLGEGAVSVWPDLIDPLGAQVLLAYASAPFENRACVTRNAFGQGAVYYIGAGLDPALMNALFLRIVEEVGLPTIDAPDSVEVCGRGDHLVVTNHGAQSVTFRGIEVRSPRLRRPARGHANPLIALRSPNSAAGVG